MPQREFDKIWIKQRNVLAYPHEWQRPAQTEEWAYQQLVDTVVCANFVEIVCFPWATLIDFLRRGRRDKATSLVRALQLCPPRTTLIRATVCQHIWAKDVLPFFQALKITDLFWSHATLDEVVTDGIRIHPFPLYPVRCFDEGKLVADFGDQLVRRRFLYSFIGTYAGGLYLTPVRQWIFELPARRDACILQREQWHYEKHVYERQIAGRALNDEEERDYKVRSEEYTTVMRQSVFALCPSGAGPNSVRLWEALGFGCIPVVISDSLRLPGDRTEWSQAIVRVPETQEAIAELPNRLALLKADQGRIGAMRRAGWGQWKKYGEAGPTTAVAKFESKNYIRALVMSQEN